jgi:hypothetical protein
MRFNALALELELQEQPKPVIPTIPLVFWDLGGFARLAQFLLCSLPIDRLFLPDFITLLGLEQHVCMPRWRFWSGILISRIRHDELSAPSHSAYAIKAASGSSPS